MRLGSLIICAVLPWALSGCAAAWRPPLDTVVPAVHPQPMVDLRPYLPGSVTSACYARRNLRDQGDPEQFYERARQQDALVEGALARRQARPVAEYLATTDEARVWRGTLWPQDAGPLSGAFFLEFDPPLVYAPLELDAGRPFVQTCQVRCFDRDAELLREGQVRRHVRFEGYETVVAGDVEYPDCVRLRLESRYRFGWWLRADTTEYVWLALDVGEVRRVERFAGVFLVFYFEEAYAYELQSEPTPGESHARDPRRWDRPWQRCAVFLDRTLPHPRLGGAVVDLADPADQAVMIRLQGGQRYPDSYPPSDPTGVVSSD